MLLALLWSAMILNLYSWYRFHKKTKELTMVIRMLHAAKEVKVLRYEDAPQNIKDIFRQTSDRIGKDM